MIRILYLVMLVLPILSLHYFGRNAAAAHAGSKIDVQNNIQSSNQNSNQNKILNLEMAARDERPSDCVVSGRCRG